MFDLISCLGQTTHIDVTLDDDFGSEELADGSRMLAADIELIGDDGQMLGGVTVEYRGIELVPITPTSANVWLNEGGERSYLGSTLEGDDLYRDDDYGDDPTARQVGLMILAHEVSLSPFSDTRLDLDRIAREARTLTHARTADIYRDALPLRAAESVLWDPRLADAMGPGEFSESHEDFLELVCALVGDGDLILRDVSTPFDASDPQAGLYRHEFDRMAGMPRRLGRLMPSDATIIDRSGHLYISRPGEGTSEARLITREQSHQLRGDSLAETWESATVPHLADLLGVSIEARRGLVPAAAERSAEACDRGNPSLSSVRAERGARDACVPGPTRELTADVGRGADER